MDVQLDLFAEPARVVERWWLGEGEKAQRESLGWERRLLSDMAAGPVVTCYPGFTGAICERLVAKGLATKTAAGFLAPPAGMTPRQLKEWGRKPDDHPKFRYEIAAAGTAFLGVGDGGGTPSTSSLDAGNENTSKNGAE